jgi:hypothetical protein
MPRLIAHVLIEGGVDAEQLAEELRSSVAALPQADSVKVMVEQPKAGVMEILTIIQVAEGAPILLGYLQGLVDKHRRKIKAVEVETGGVRVDVNKLTPDQRAALEAAHG